MYIVLSSHEVILNWDNIKSDSYNNRPEIKTPYEFIHEARHGRVSVGGYKIIINDKLPEFE